MSIRIPMTYYNSGKVSSNVWKVDQSLVIGLKMQYDIYYDN